MTYYSKVALGTGIGGIALFIWQYGQLRHALLGPEGEAALARHYGSFYLKYLGFTAALTVLLVILSHILGGAVNSRVPETSDERDRLIELKSLRNAGCAFAAGFFLGALMMALGRPVRLMLDIMAYSQLLMGLALQGSYIFYYERGH